jgi:membrane fusion protein, heavy metal efflux system
MQCGVDGIGGAALLAMDPGRALPPNHTLMLCLFAVGACARSEAAEPPPTEAPSGAGNWSSLTFVKAATCPAHWSDDVPARVAFDERHTSRLSVPLGGRITNVFVERGERVAAGAALFVVASADLADLRSQREKAVIELATARTTLERVRALVEAKSLPAKELAIADQNAIEARLALQTSEQKLASLRVNASGDTSFTVTAPRAGIVVEHHISVGQQVTSDAAPLLAIADISDVWVYADLLDDATHELEVGSQARVTMDGDAIVEGTIDQISAIVDPDRHTVPVRVRLDNPTGSLRPGAYAQVRFLDAAAATICVPATAALSDGTRHYVYVRTVGKIRRREVVAGQPIGALTTVRDGLAVGDEVVAQGGGVLDNQLSSED